MCCGTHKREAKRYKHLSKKYLTISNICLGVPKGEKEAILEWILAENFPAKTRNQFTFLRIPTDHKQDNQKEPENIIVKPQENKEKEYILKADRQK